MEIQVYQLLTFTLYPLLALLYWVVKGSWPKVFIAFLAFILFAMNPIRHKEEGGASLEASTSRFKDIPNQIVIKEKTFKQKQEDQLQSLKTDSENLKYEVHD